MTAADSLMVNGYGNLFMDPAWQQYWAMSQQMNSQNYAQQLAALQQSQGATTTAGTTATSSPSFHGAVPRAEEPKKGGNGAAIALAATSIAAIGAAALISRGRAKAPETKGLWNQLCAGVKSLGKSSEKVIYDETKKVVTIPGQTHKITVADDLEALKANANVPKLTTKNAAGKPVRTDGVKIQAGSMVHNGNTITWDASGKVTKYTNKAGDDILSHYTNATEANDIAYKATLDDIIAKLAKGEYVEGISSVKATQISHFEDGILKIFKADTSGNLQFAEAVTDKYAIGSDALNQLTSLNENVRKAIVEIGKPANESTFKITAENIQSATYKPDGKDFTLHIGAGGQVEKITNGTGTTFEMGSTGYDAIYSDPSNKKIFKNLFDDTSKFENVFAIL